MEPKEKFILYTLAAINFTHIMDSMIMMPLGDVFMKLYQIGPQKFSILVSSYATAAFLSSLIGVVYLDRFDRRRVLIFIYSGFTFGTLLCGFATSYYALLGLRFITGLFGGMIGAIVLSVVSDTFTFTRRGKAMGILMAAFSTASALGVPFGLFLADYFSWNMPFFFIGGIGLGILSIVVLRFPSLQDHLTSIRKKTIFNSFGDIVKDTNQANGLILGMVLVLGHFLIIPFIAPYMTRNVGFTQSQITLIYLFGGGATVFTAPFIGKMTDQLGANRVFMVLMLISFIPVLLVTHLGVVGLFWGLLVTTLFFVFGSGRMIAPQAMITATAGPATRGGFMSLKSALQQLAIALASFIAGAIVQFDDQDKIIHYEFVGYLSIVICLLAIYLGSKLKVAQGN